MNCGCKSRYLPIGSVTKTCLPSGQPCGCSAPVVTNIDAFSMPACGSSIDVTFDCPLTLPEGVYLWNPDIGYLKVTALSVSDSGLTSVLSLLNPCYCPNVALGTNILSYQSFILTDANPDTYCTYTPVVTSADLTLSSIVLGTKEYFSSGNRVKVQVSFTLTIAGTGKIISVTIPLAARLALRAVGYGQMYLTGTPASPIFLAARMNVSNDGIELHKVDSSNLPTGDYTVDFYVDYERTVF